jgi:hypothetical protein
MLNERVVSPGVYTYNLSRISSRLVCFSFGMTNYRTSRPDDSPTHTILKRESKKPNEKKIKRFKFFKFCIFFFWSCQATRVDPSASHNNNKSTPAVLYIKF